MTDAKEDTSLIQCLKNDIEFARRQKDKETVNVLSSFLSSVAPSGNEGEVSNDKVKVAVKKWINNIEETMETYDLSADYKEKLINEINILSDYLPNNLSQEDIKSEVEMIIQQYDVDLTEKKSFGFIIQTLKSIHGASVDGKLANQIITERMKHAN